MPRKILLVELNEVPFQILDHFCDRHPESFLARFAARCDQYTTMASDAIQLDPWITWATFHRGVNDEKHHILHLGQDLTVPDREYPPVWQILQEQGKRVGIFGSLHSSNMPDDYDEYAFYLPDFFANEQTAHPRSLESFQEFNLVMTRASARNVDRAVPLRSAVSFVARAPMLGVTPDTALRVAGQVIGEVFKPEIKIRRRSIQPLLMGDLFDRLLAREAPDFATFYTNNVASSMHRFWAATFPGHYDEFPLEDGWVDRYRDEIDFAMEKFSRLLGRMVRVANRLGDYTVVLASSMGQDAVPAEETYEFLSVSDLGRFMNGLGVPTGGWQTRNAMVPCISVVVDEAHRETFRQNLGDLVISGAPMVRDQRPVHPVSWDEGDNGSFHVLVQFDAFTGPDEAIIGERRYRLVDLGLGMVAHEDGVNCTAQHVPEGMLLVYDPSTPRAERIRDRRVVPTVDFVPSLLEHFGLPLPLYLQGSPSIRLERQQLASASA